MARELYEVVPSTQDRAVLLARAGAEPGTRVVARRQTGGRGRDGRGWVSPAGGLYLSIVLRSPESSAGLLPLAIGAHLGEQLTRRYSVPLRLKWPNDLVVPNGPQGPRKLSGILVDEVPSPAGRRAVAGIGVNVDVPDAFLPAELADRAATLAEFTTPPPPLVEVEEVVAAAAVDASADLAGPGGREGTIRRCSALLYGVGQRAVVEGPEPRRGTVLALGPEGGLRLAAAEGTIEVRTGSLRFEERS